MSDERKKSILIVDDTAENLDVLKGMLNEQYAVRVATNGRIALKIAYSERPPDLVLLDVMMPDLDGYDVIRQLKEEVRTRNIPVIFVTAKTETEYETLGFSLGAADYITKPFSLPVVLARVRTHLELHDRACLLEARVQERTFSLVIKTRELEASNLEILRRLGRAAEFRDNETGMHVIRLSQYVYLMAKTYGMTEAEAEQLMLASMMHDVGKIGIPDHILLKPGRLTPAEFDAMKRHTDIGAEIIGSQQSDLLQLASLVARTHHEKWNGNGYPLGLKGEEIPLAGRITAVADVFDALTSERPYKHAWTVDEAMDAIRDEAGEGFDPHLVELFLRIRPEVEEVMATHQEGLKAVDIVALGTATGSPE